MLKRFFDVVVATTLLVLTLPMMLLLAVVIAVSLRANPFFAQERIGRSGRIFTMIKFRTLPPSAPKYADKHAIAGVEAPPLCQLIRRLHLDELPQLLLVLTGRMSLVGPRPEMAFLHEAMSPEFARIRTSVRPGATGLWQVSDQCAGLIADAPEFDRYYVEHANLRLDLWVMFRTVHNAFTGGHGVAFEDLPRWAPLAAVGPEPRLAAAVGD